jgi:predicted deacetylase
VRKLYSEVTAGIYGSGHNWIDCRIGMAPMPELKGDNQKEEEEEASSMPVNDHHDGANRFANKIDFSVHQKKVDYVLKNNNNNKRLFAIVTIHDVAPEYSDKIFRAADELEKLHIRYNLAIIPYLKKRKDNLVSRNPEFVRKVLGYGQEIALHGNYHETDDGKIEDFHTFSTEESKNHLQSAISVFKHAGMKTNVFIPPTWAISTPTIDNLIQLGFNILETKEEVLFLDNKKTSRLHANVLNWDQTGSPHKNNEYLTKNKQLYRQQVVQEKSQLIRIAIHPKDPEEALQDQIEMIQGLKAMNYSLLDYGEIIRFEWQGAEEEKILFSSQRAQARRS